MTADLLKTVILELLFNSQVPPKVSWVIGFTLVTLLTRLNTSRLYTDTHGQNPSRGNTEPSIR